MLCVGLALLPTLATARASAPAHVQAAPVARAVESVRLAGREYVRLPDWARANGLVVRWLKPDETVQLSNSSWKFILNVDSRQADVNGIEVWLLFPVLQNNGAVYLAQLDAQSTLRPLLFPAKNRAGARIMSICLDPGHGGKDPGNCVGVNQEKRYTLLFAQEVRDQLKRAGFNVTLTRSGDSFVDLPLRANLAQRRRADLFVSLHFNSAENSRDSVKGAQVFCLTPAGANSTNARGEGGDLGWCAGNRNNDQNLFLAYQVQKALIQNLPTEDHGLRRARFAVLRDALVPAVLIEAGFMSHPIEGRKIFTETYRRQMARAIVQGLLAYKRLVER